MLPNWLGIKYSTTTDSILRTTNNLTGLVMKVNHNNIPHYIIHHTSMNFKFNSGENLDLKRDIPKKNLKQYLSSDYIIKDRCKIYDLTFCLIAFNTEFYLATVLRKTMKIY